MQARERGLACQLDEIGGVLPIGSLQPFERSLPVVDCPINSCDVVGRNIAVTTFAEFLHDSLHGELVSSDGVRLRQPSPYRWISLGRHRLGVVANGRDAGMFSGAPMTE